MIEHLMTIDDEPIDQKLYKRMIRKSGLVETLTQAMSGPEALEYLSRPDSLPVDVILLDINMPAMNGFEFLETATDRFGTGFVRYAVLMLSTSTRPEDRARALSFEVVRDFLPKPLTMEALHQIDDRLATLKTEG